MGAMKELLRTTDPVRLSWLTALLADQDIEAIVFDTHTSILEGSVSAIPRRIMVIDEDFSAACKLLMAAGEMADPDPQPDKLLGGQVRLRQPESGYRVAIDPVLLAAASFSAPGSAPPRCAMRSGVRAPRSPGWNCSRNWPHSRR